MCTPPRIQALFPCSLLYSIVLTHKLTKCLTNCCINLQINESLLHSQRVKHRFSIPRYNKTPPKCPTLQWTLLSQTPYISMHLMVSKCPTTSMDFIVPNAIHFNVLDGPKSSTNSMDICPKPNHLII
eukprot:657457_1